MATNYEFLTIVGKHYKSIKLCFQTNVNSLKLLFDEDIFHDTIMKCAEAYKDSDTDIKKIKAYLWISYKTNLINKLERYKPMESLEELKDFDIIDIEYLPEMDELLDVVQFELYNKFDSDIVNAWFEHVVNNKTYEDIEKTFNIHNLHYQFKKIRNYIRTELPLKNKRFKDLLNILTDI
jgi:hypothetical protein